VDRDETWTALQVQGRLALSALKPDEGGTGLILRLYEPAGDRVQPHITVPPGWTLGPQVNLLEEPVAGDTTFGPFQIRSFQLVRT
jgi:alpha-mannosidase